MMKKLLTLLLSSSAVINLQMAGGEGTMQGAAGNIQRIQI